MEQSNLYPDHNDKDRIVDSAPSLRLLDSTDLVRMAENQRRVSATEHFLLARELLEPRFKLLVKKDVTLVLRVKDMQKKEVEIIQNEDILRREATALIADKLKKTPEPTLVTRVIDAFKDHSVALKSQPLPIAWKTQDEWTFKKLDFEPKEGPYPAWSEFLYRLSSASDFMAFIWSIFELETISRQFCYVYDSAGQGGKSTVTGVIQDLMGDACAALSTTQINSSSRWLFGTLFGKRLAVWADCKNPKFCMSELIRNITSGDPVTIEFKGQNPFTDRIYVRLLIGSNHPPEITGGGADRSRLLRLDLAENTSSKNDPTWRQRLKDELPFFLYACKEQYMSKCANHGDIELSKESIDLVYDSTGSVEERWEDIADRELFFDTSASMNSTQWLELCKEEGLSPHDIGHFKTYLEQKPGVKIARDRTKAGRDRTKYQGFRRKLFEDRTEAAFARERKTYKAFCEWQAPPSKTRVE